MGSQVSHFLNLLQKARPFAVGEKRWYSNGKQYTKRPDGKIVPTGKSRAVKTKTSPKPKTTQRKATKPTKKYMFSRDEGVVRWNAQRKRKEIGVRRDDGRITPRAYHGRQKVGGKATRVEISHYRTQEVSAGRGGRVIKDGTVMVRDGQKKVAIRDSKGTVHYFKYYGPAKPMAHGLVLEENLASQKEIDRLKAVHFEEEKPQEFPKDYSDLVPIMSLSEYMGRGRRQRTSPKDVPNSIVPQELREFSDDLPLTKLLTKVSDLRSEIILSRMKGSKTGRPWFKGSVVKIGKGYYHVRHYWNITHPQNKATLRQYVLSPATKRDYESRPVRLLKNHRLSPGDIRTLTNRETGRSYQIRIDEVKERFDIPGRDVMYEMYGRVLNPEQKRELKQREKREGSEERKQARTETKELEALFQFKQGTLGEEDHSLWSSIYGSYLLDRQDRITEMQIATEKLRSAKAKGRTSRTIRTLERKLEDAKEAFKGYGSINDERPKEGFNPQSYVKQLATDATGGRWYSHEGKVYYDKSDYTTWTTTAAPKLVRAAVKKGILRKPK